MNIRRLSHWLASGALAFLVLFSAPVLGQRNLVVEQPAAAPDQRLALVIGNTSYKDAPLRNPSNDAADMARALRELGWKVILRTKATQRQMKEAIREFGEGLAQGGTGLFYFAGHGVQYRGENYLVPVDAAITREAHIEDETVSARFVLTQLDEARTRTSIVIIDACRNNPFTRGFRSASRGLAQMDAAQGTLIAFATAPGSVAADGEERNGVYTKHLLRQLQAPGIPVELMFKRVRDNVMEETKDQQIPWESSSLRGADFYFRPTLAVAAATPGTAAPLVDPMTVELAFWNSIKESKHPDEFKLYLDQYPRGQFAALAKARLQTLGPAAAAPATVAAVTPAAAPATVYVYRKSQMMGAAHSYPISSKGRIIGLLGSGSYLMHKATPGELILTADGVASVSRSYEVEAGKTYYIEFSTGWTSVNFQLVDEKEGLLAVERLQSR